ncbi:MAG: DUF4297 domain-containing protein [Magnetococcales bacterium]|nr:DUF4297 domain-containing protein [Nitrospirota bacterium]
MTDKVSYKDLTPNTGGPEAQEGFSYQHHVAVSHFIDMLNRRDLIRINLEQIDDITLIWQDGDEEIVELVQVKKGNKIWHISDIASKNKKKKKLTVEKQIIKKQLFDKQVELSDRIKEKVVFKLVTVRDIHKKLEILKEERGEDRSKNEKSIELIRKLKDKLPGYGEKIDNWVNNCYWRNAGGENAVINDNRTKLEKFLDEEGYAIGSTKCTSFVKERLYEYVARKSKEKPPTLTFIERESFKEWFDKEIRSYITELTIFKDLRYSNTKSVKETRRLFDVGIFYENIEYIVKIIDNLAKYGRSLITGKPGSGKSAIACYIGLKLLKEGTFNRVFYLYGRDSVTDKVDDIFNEIKNHDRKDVLFIIDDCHLMAGKVNNLLYRWEQVSEAKLLLISRDIAPDLVDPDSDTENYFKVLEEYIVKIKYTSDSIKEIMYPL